MKPGEGVGVAEGWCSQWSGEGAVTVGCCGGWGTGL